MPDAGDPPDYRDTFRAAIRSGDGRTPEQWIRAVFEGAPAGVPSLVFLGWRTVLRLRLGPRASAEHVLGWRIADREAGSVGLKAAGPLLSAELRLRLDPTTTELSTRVWFRRWAARWLWALTTPVHRLLTRWLLHRARSEP